MTRGKTVFVAVLLALTALLDRAPSAWAVASLALDPLTGPPGTSVAVSGSGFCALCGPVTVTFNGRTLEPAAAVGLDGTFTMSITVPLDAVYGAALVVVSQPGNTGDADPTKVTTFFRVISTATSVSSSGAVLRPLTTSNPTSATGAVPPIQLSSALPTIMATSRTTMDGSHVASALGSSLMVDAPLPTSTAQASELTINATRHATLAFTAWVVADVLLLSVALGGYLTLRTHSRDPGGGRG